VTGVPDGYYLLEFCADPDSAIEESSETNNCSSNLVQLLNMGTPQKTVVNLGAKMMYVYDKTRPLAPADAERESEPTEYRLWARRSRRETAARPMLKGE